MIVKGQGFKHVYLLLGIFIIAVSGILLKFPNLVQARAVSPEQAVARSDENTIMASPAEKPERISVLVYLEPGTDRGPVRALANQKGGTVRYEYKAVMPNVLNLRSIPVTALPALQNIPGVIKVEEDVYHPNLIKLDESTPLVQGLQSQITGAGYSADGSGIRVCVCDTGIDMDHIMYSDRIDTAASYDFVNNDNNPDDDHGHGAHVAGIAVGGIGLTVNFEPPVCDGDEPFQGVAPEATLIGAKILNQNGGGSDSDIVAGIDHCADQSASGGQADVINLSIGRGQYSGFCDSEAWAVAVNNAVANGVVVVAASGNEGYSNALATPACASGSIAVGATYKADYPRCEDSQSSFDWCLDFFCFSSCTDNSPSADQLVCFSNQSDNLDVTAPGSVIWSASVTSITEMSGTSMASPHVAGLAALILDMDPTLTPEDVRQIIREGATDMGPTGFDRGYGYGRIDVLNSLALIGPQCQTNGDCDDSDPCTTDICTSGVCSNDPKDCDDSNPCTTDYCSDGTCFSDPIKCDDGDLCTTDSCDPITGCEYTQIDCNPGEVCINGDCVPQVCNNNGTCESGEDCNNCPNDCISGGGGGGCGNGVCEPSLGEDCQSCAADCRGKQVGAAKKQFCCGDGDGSEPVGCDDPRCTDEEEGFTCSDVPPDPYCCGDDSCVGEEDSYNCEVDCGPAPQCGDNICNGEEDECTCPEDCTDPPPPEVCSDGKDNDCDDSVDCSDPDCYDVQDCQCKEKGEICYADDECCNNKCRGGACR